MIEKIKSYLPIPRYQELSFFKKSIVVFIALIALAKLAGYIYRSLVGRVQDLDNREDLDISEDLYTEGYVNYENQEYGEAIDKLALALQYNPKPALKLKILIARAECCIKTQQWDYALADLTAQEQLPLTTDQLLYVRAEKVRIFSLTGRHDSVIEVCDLALSLDVGVNPKAWLFLCKGCSQFSLGQNLEAIQSFQKGEDLHPSNHNTHIQILFFRSKVYLAINEDKKALKDLKRVKDKRSSIPNLHINASLELAQLYFRKGQEEKANKSIKSAEEVGALSPYQRALISYVQGCFYRDKKEPSFSLAFDAFRKAFELDPSVKPDIQAQIYWMSGMVCIEQKNYGIAMDRLSNALDCNPAPVVIAMILFAHGKLCLIQRYFREAITDFTTALSHISGGEARALLLFHRSEAYSKMKKIELAILDCDEALRCEFENDSLREKITKYLQALERAYESMKSILSFC